MVNLAGAMAGPPARKATPRKYFMIGWAIIIAVFGGLFAWSVFAPFEGAVLASGTVSVESRHKAIQHLEGGIVAEIAVANGDHVEASELLIRLDGTPIQAQLDNIDARLIDLIAREARLIAERDGSTDIALRPVPSDLDGAPALVTTVESQSALLNARAEARRTRVSILNQRMAQLRERITGITAEIGSTENQVRILEDEMRDLAGLVEQELAPRPRLLALEREQSQLQGRIESLKSESSGTRVQIGETELEVLSLTDGFREDVIEELNDVQTEVAALLTERTAAADRLKRLDIRAPRSGLVLGLTTNTIGGVISPGEPIMHIVPQDDELVSLVRVMPQDIDKITVGQAARLRFSAFNQNETPEVPATVTTISADAVVDQNTGMSYYEVTIALPSNTPLGDSFPIVPGMPVDAMVSTESRNVLSYLLKPLRDSLSRTFRE